MKSPASSNAAPLVDAGAAPDVDMPAPPHADTTDHAYVDAGLVPPAVTDASEPECTGSACNDTECAKGFARDSVSGTCIDIDDCAKAEPACAQHATCTQSQKPGRAPKCKCNEGYLGDGQSCEPGVVSIAAGYAQACAIRGDTSLWCWGDNSSSQIALASVVERYTAVPRQVGVDLGWTAVSTYDRSTCGIRLGKLYCWGANDNGQLGIGSKDTTAHWVPRQVGSSDDWVRISVGSTHACGIRETSGDRALSCWGVHAGVGTADAPQKIPLQISSAKDWDEVSAGSDHTCALRAGALYCWGLDIDGSLGLGLTGGTEIGTPTRVGTQSDWVEISVGFATCGLRTTGELFCWGASSYVPHPIAATATVPTRVGDWHDWEHIALGAAESFCGSRADGSVWCSEVGVAQTTLSAIPVRLEAHDGYDQIAVGGHFACGERAGLMQCWGDGSRGRLGASEIIPGSVVPLQVSAAPGWTTVSAATQHTCGILNGAAFCWGNQGEALHAGTPTQVDSSSAWTEVSAGSSAAAYGIQNGQLEFWGSDISRKVLPAVPTLASSLAGWASVSLSETTFYGSYGCGILGAGGNLYCWGSGDAGRLGTGEAGDKAEPTAVGTSSTWRVVSAGASHACGIDAGGMYCWGSNSNAELGLGASETATVKLTPQRVGKDADWTRVAAGDQRTCGIRSGQLSCWGAGYGSAPTAVAGYPSPWTEVSTQAGQTCGVHANGLLQCWGDNRYGQLGVGEKTMESIVNWPTEVPGDWLFVDVGTRHVCGIQTDRTLWCWGSNDFGQMGVGPAWSDEPLDVDWPAQSQ